MSIDGLLKIAKPIAILSVNFRISRGLRYGLRLWRVPDATYRGFTEAGILASRDLIFGEDVITLDPATGDVQRDSDDEPAVRHRDADAVPTVALPEWMGLDEARSLPEFQRMPALQPPAPSDTVGVCRDPRVLLVSYSVPAESYPVASEGHHHDG
jgi:hypothetical protein